MHLDMRLSRAKLEQMIAPLVERSMDSVRKALADAKKSPKEIDEVVLVGGSTRVPLVQETVKKFFGKDPHKGVNPDEVVAVGAAVQAGVLSGDVKDLVLLDVTPLSLGVETLGGVMTTMIQRNTTIPTQKKEIFSTATDSQPSVEIHVLQGERTEARYNRTLGKFHLEGIMPAPRGVPKVEVTFDIDANGILSVHAKDTATGKDQKITITANSGLNEAEIQKMVKDAQEHEARGQGAPRADRAQKQARQPLLHDRKDAQREQGQDPGSGPVFARGPHQGGPRGRREAGRREGAGRERSAREGSASPRRPDVRRQRRAGRPNGEPPPPGEGPPPGADGGGKKGGKDGGVIDAEFEETGG